MTTVPVPEGREKKGKSVSLVVSDGDSEGGKSVGYPEKCQEVWGAKIEGKYCKFTKGEKEAGRGEGRVKNGESTAGK